MSAQLAGSLILSVIIENLTLNVLNKLVFHALYRKWHHTTEKLLLSAAGTLIQLLCRRCHILYICYSLYVDVLPPPLTRGLPSSHLGHVVRPRAPCMATWQRCCEMSLCCCSQWGSELLQGLSHGGRKQMEQESQLKVRLQGSPQRRCSF